MISQKYNLLIKEIHDLINFLLVLDFRTVSKQKPNADALIIPFFGQNQQGTFSISY